MQVETRFMHQAKLEQAAKDRERNEAQLRADIKREILKDLR